MSIKSGFPLVQYKQSLFTTAPFLTVATNVGASKLIGTLPAGSYLASWNYSMTLTTITDKFDVGGFGAISSNADYAGGGIVTAVVDIPLLVAGQVLRGNNDFLITVAVDTPIYVYWKLITTTNAAAPGNTWSATQPTVATDALMNTLSLIRLA